MYYMQAKVAGNWVLIAPTNGQPYQYGTKAEAERMLAICYPDQIREHRLGGAQAVRVVEECSACGSINPHQAERDGYTGLCDNCQAV